MIRMAPTREWIDKRDNTHWMLWLVRCDRPVLAFAAESGARYSIEVGFRDELEDRSDYALQELLDRAKAAA